MSRSNRSHYENIDKSVGSFIHKQRKSRGLNLEKTSELTGLSISMISKIERGVTSPSVRSLYALSQGLDIPVGQIFTGHDAPNSTDPDENGLVVRQVDRKVLDFGEKRLLKELLTPQPIGKLELLMVVLSPGGSTGEDSFSHDGEEGGVVLSGALELSVDDKTFVLHPGDSFAFESHKNHWFRNASDEETRVLWVNTPPIY